MSHRHIPSRPCESQRSAFTALGFESAETDEASIACWQRNGVIIGVPALHEFDLPTAGDFILDFAFGCGVTHQAQRLLEALRQPRAELPRQKRPLVMGG